MTHLLDLPPEAPRRRRRGRGRRLAAVLAVLVLLLVGALVGDRVRPYLTPANGLLFAGAGLTAWLALLGVRRLHARRQPA